VEVVDLWVEVGASSAEEASSLGIRVGDPVLAKPGLQTLSGGRILSKALDNRIGCAVVLEIAEGLKPEGLDFTLYLAASVQEEIGSRGAGMLGEKLSPSIALVLDTVAGLGAGSQGPAGIARLGRGPVLRVADFIPDWVMGAHYSPAIRRHLRGLAEEAGIPCQEDVAQTWTDAATLHRSGAGVPTAGLLVPRLHAHSPAEVADLADIEAASRLASAFVSSLDAKAVLTLRGGRLLGGP
jgi:putative aminopeptidase FrvX